MPRPRRTDRPVEKSISLPQSLCTQVDLILWSDLEQRVPHGAWASLIQSLLEAHIKEIQHGQAPK
jgi:hypothetical protein